jgi:hypothetical protein
MKSEWRCHVCTSHRRVEIENAILKGWAPGTIANLLAKQGDDVSAKSIQNHIHGGHMPADPTIRRVAIEQRTAEMGRIIEDEEGSLVDHIGLLTAVQQRTFERIVMGEIEPEVTDGIAAAKALAALQIQSGGQVDTDILMQAIVRMMEVWEELLPDEVFQTGLRSLQDDPVLASLEARRRSNQEQMAIASGA